jgi:3-oxoacyl-[acyl-carrier protein] reductase
MPATIRSRRFQGRCALVTGAARGIGLAIARRLAQESGKVVLADLDVDRARSEAARLGNGASGERMDVSDAGSVTQAISAVIDRLGHLDILVNNAGIHGPAVPIWQLTDDDWQEVLAVDLSGPFYCCRAVIPHMQARKYGRIVNVASVAGKEGNPNAIPYSSAKAGVIGLTKALAKEVARDGVLVNAVTPAVIDTDILKQVSPEHVQYMISRIPIGRVGQAEEVAALVAWLCSEECSFSTGGVFDISGGRATY